ncbi:IclR family transcriptional regulator domain-containing protein [Planomonospora parontospora]|uniref:IclR family transcriptional regulator domain-containing protein n=1 Tax=Planomonospora parontospora TaxID=58119 RepID=UPI001940F975|nr:IclR family transcriptional regulator C-terminal domain-containing protein [Planomonospora parontospora]GGL43326.1 transcriptional regulator [Planomonospora parontospora subsp. antibiotica]GII18496.1 transcriptional regulator [Planomonospora parontospora subsp. antibiotica]
MEPAGTVERGLAVLRALCAEPRRRTRATDLVRTTGLARSTVDRVLATFVHLGHLRIDDRDVLLAPRLMELGEAYLNGSGLPRLLGPHARRLADELDESVSLAVPDGADIRFIGQFTRRRTLSVAFRVGDTLPADRCAAGLILRDPSAPWAEDDQLVEPGLVAIAMPVRDPGGRAVCALSAVSHTSRHTAAGLREHVLPRLRETAAAMETALRTAPAPQSPPAAFHDASRAAKAELGTEYLQSLARALAVLVALGSAPGGLTLADAARATGLPRATVRRAVQALERTGYAAADGTRFVLLPRVLELGYAHLSELSLQQIAQPHLADLVARVRESASLAVLSGDDVVYVARVPTVGIMSVDITVGTRFPAYATSMGRVLLAGLPGERLAAITPRPLTSRTVASAGELAAAVRQAARDGYALVDQELEEGVRSIAVPVRDGTGRTVAAVNVATHAGRATPAGLVDRVLPELRRTAARIEADLRHVPAALPGPEGV